MRRDTRGRAPGNPSRESYAGRMSLRPSATCPRAHGLYCWSTPRTVSPSTVIQTPVASGSYSCEVTRAVHDLRQLRHRHRRGSELGRVTLVRQDRHLGPVRDDVRERAVALVDRVVIVRHRLAGLDRSVLLGGLVRRHAGEQQRRVESQCIVVADADERRDVPVFHLLLRRPETGLGRARDGDRLGDGLRATAPRDRDDADHGEQSDADFRPNLAAMPTPSLR